MGLAGCTRCTPYRFHGGRYNRYTPATGALSFGVPAVVPLTTLFLEHSHRY